MTLTRSSNVKRFIFPNGKSSNDRVLFHQPRNVYIIMLLRNLSKWYPKSLTISSICQTLQKKILEMYLFFLTHKITINDDKFVKNN